MHTPLSTVNCIHCCCPLSVLITARTVKSCPVAAGLVLCLAKTMCLSPSSADHALRRSMNESPTLCPDKQKGTWGVDTSSDSMAGLTPPCMDQSAYKVPTHTTSHHKGGPEPNGGRPVAHFPLCMPTLNCPGLDHVTLLGWGHCVAGFGVRALPCSRRGALPSPPTVRGVFHHMRNMCPGCRCKCSRRTMSSACFGFLYDVDYR